MMSDKICNDGVCDVNDKLKKMSSTEDDNVSICANCGKEGSNLKSCTACKLVKYCNRECQIAHRPQHKKVCKKRAAELHDEKLFKQPHWSLKIVRCASNNSLPWIRGRDTNHVAVRLYAQVVFMHLYMITKAMKLIIKSVHFVELQH